MVVGSATEVRSGNVRIVSVMVTDEEILESKM